VYTDANISTSGDISCCIVYCVRHQIPSQDIDGLYPEVPAKNLDPGILAVWRCQLIELGGEEDHIHLLVEIHPALNISTLINNLKSASSKRVRNKFTSHVTKFYWKPYLWNRAYFVGSVGNVTLETIMRYVEQQGTKESTRNPKGTA